MDKNNVRRLGAIASGLFLLLFLILIPVLYFILDVPLLIVAIIAVVYFGIAAVVVYEVILRLKEIDGGLDDAVDDY